MIKKLRDNAELAWTAYDCKDKIKKFKFKIFYNQ